MQYSGHASLWQSQNIRLYSFAVVNNGVLHQANSYKYVIKQQVLVKVVAANDKVNYNAVVREGTLVYAKWREVA